MTDYTFINSKGVFPPTNLNTVGTLCICNNMLLEVNFL